MPISGVLREESDAESLNQLARVSFFYSNVAITASAVIILLSNRVLATIFGIQSDGFYLALLCFCLYIPFFMNGSLFIAWYTGIKRIKQANIMVLAQDMLLPTLLIALFTLAGHERIIWFYLPATGIVSAALLILLIVWSRKLSPRISVPFLLDVDSGGGVLSFSVECEAEKASEASTAVRTFLKENGLEKRKVMLLSLAIEELISLISNYGSSQAREKRDDISVRLAFSDGGTVMRLRTGGSKFNPIAHYENNLPTFGSIEESLDFMGLKYILEASEVVYYRETFGVNSLVIII